MYEGSLFDKAVEGLTVADVRFEIGAFLSKTFGSDRAVRTSIVDELVQDSQLPREIA
jgi:hypothetical protein